MSTDSKSVAKAKTAKDTKTICGLVFPVNKTRRVLRTVSAVEPTIQASIYSAAVLEFLAADILEASGNVLNAESKSRGNVLNALTQPLQDSAVYRQRRITPRHIRSAVAQDPELAKLFGKAKTSTPSRPATVADAKSCECSFTVGCNASDQKSVVVSEVGLWRAPELANWCALMDALQMVASTLAAAGRFKKLIIVYSGQGVRRACEEWLNRFHPSESLMVEYCKFDRLLLLRQRREYALDLYRSSTLVERNKLLHQNTNTANPSLWQVMQPLLHVLDAHHLGVTTVFGDSFDPLYDRLAKELWPGTPAIRQVSLPPVSPMMLTLPLMCANRSFALLKEQVQKLFCPPTSTDNPVYEFVRRCMLPHGHVTVNSLPIHGGPISIADAKTLAELIDSKALFPTDLKATMLDFLTLRLADRLSTNNPSFFKRL